MPRVHGATAMDPQARRLPHQFMMTFVMATSTNYGATIGYLLVAKLVAEGISPSNREGKLELSATVFAQVELILPVTADPTPKEIGAK